MVEQRICIQYKCKAVKMKFRLETVRNLANFIKKFSESYTTDYKIFDGNYGDLLITIYDFGTIEVYVSKNSYEVVFADYSDYENLSLDEVMAEINKWVSLWENKKKDGISY